jgi:hypothetical protein
MTPLHTGDSDHTSATVHATPTVMRGFHQPVHWHSNAPLHVICLMVLKRDKTGMSFGWACLMADGGCLAACCGDLQLRPALSWHGCIPCLPARLWLHNKCWDAQSPTSSYLPQFPAVSSPVTPSHQFLFVGSIALGILRFQQYTLFVNNSIALYPASILIDQLAIDTTQCTPLPSSLRSSLSHRPWPRLSKKASLQIPTSRKDARLRCRATLRLAFKTSLPQQPSVRQLKRYEASHQPSSDLQY